MMNFTLNAALSLSIGLGAIIGWLRFRKADPAFLPIILLLTIGFFNEITSIILAQSGRSNVINFNFFQLIESVLLTWQFKNWGLFGRRKKFFFGLQFFFVVVWVVDFIVKKPFPSFNSYYLILQSFIVVMMSISMINMISFTENGPLIRQPIFLICMALILFYTYAILVETFWIHGLYKSVQFRVLVFSIMTYINFITNIVLAFAFLWIPMRPQYILRS